MKKIIGGLLVLSLLSRPTAIKINFIAYEIFKSQQEAAILAEYKKDSDIENSKGNPIDVGSMIDGISNNNKNISILMKKKNDVIEKIKTVLDFKSLAKRPMTDEQLRQFIQFNEFCKKEGRTLRETLNKIDARKDLALVKREIMQLDTDYNTVERELKEITYYQGRAMSCLDSIIDLGEKTLVLI